MSRILDLYARKIMQGDHSNLIPEEIEVLNYSPHSLGQARVRASPIKRDDSEPGSEEKLLYNMAFILDSLQQDDSSNLRRQPPLALNVIDFVSQLELQPSREGKYALLQQLASRIESSALARD